MEMTNNFKFQEIPFRSRIKNKFKKGLIHSSIKSTQKDKNKILTMLKTDFISKTSKKLEFPHGALLEQPLINSKSINSNI